MNNGFPRLTSAQKKKKKKQLFRAMLFPSGNTARIITIKNHTQIIVLYVINLETKLFYLTSIRILLAV